MLIVLKRLHQFVVPMMLGLSPIAAIAETPKLPISCPGCNLRGIDFNSAVMGDKYFIDSNFANADLRHADLSNMYMLTTNMEGADLRGANLSQTFFTRYSNFRGADLRGANLNHTWFTDADLRGADLRGTNVEAIHTLEGADLRGAIVDENFYTKVMADQPYGICLNNTTLPNGNKVGASCEFR